MNPIGILRSYVGNAYRSTQLLAEIREGIANLANVVDRRLASIENQILDARHQQSALLPAAALKEKVDEIRQHLAHIGSGTESGAGLSVLRAGEPSGYLIKVDDLVAELQQSVASQQNLQERYTTTNGGTSKRSSSAIVPPTAMVARP